MPKNSSNPRSTPDLYRALALPESEMHTALVEIAKEWEQRLKPRHPQWVQQIKFVEGEQWGFFNRKSWDWVTHSVARPEVREARVTLNFMQPTIQQVRAVMSREMPVFGGYAATSDSVDVSASRYSDNLLRFLWRHHHLQDLYGDVCEFAATVGTWFVEPIWNKSGGRSIDAGIEDITEPEFEEYEDTETGVTQYRMTKEPEVRYRKEPEGELEFRMYSPFEVINAPGSSLHDPGEALVTVTDVRLSEIQTTYGDKAKDIVPDATPDQTGASEVHRIRSPGSTVGGSAATEEYAEAVRLYRMFVRSCKEWPRGREIHFTEQGVLWTGDNPVYPAEGETEEQWPRYHFPIFPFRHYTRASAYHGKGVAQDLIDPQLTLNGAASKEIKILKDHAHPRLRVPIGSKVDLSNRTDAVIEYSPRFGPDEVSYLKGGDMPEALRDTVERYRNYMEMIAGVSGMQRTYAEDSGRKLQLMQQSDMGKLGPIKARHDRQMGEVMHHALMLWKRHATNERKVLVVGENMQIDLISFNEGSISGSTDVVVQNDTSLPQDPMARQLAIRNILESTANMDDESKGQAWELYGVRDFLKIEQTKWADRNRAREENILMTRGDPVTVEFWEHDDQHVAEHVAEMNTTSWRMKVMEEAREFGGDVQQSPLYQRFVKHVTDHAQSKQKKMGVGAPGMSPGQPPAPSAAPPQAAPSAPTGAPQPRG